MNAMFYDLISKEFARRILATLLKDIPRPQIEAWYKQKTLQQIREDAAAASGDWVEHLTLIADLADVLFWGALDVAVWALGIELDRAQLDSDREAGIGWTLRGQSVGHMALGGVHFVDVSRFGTTAETALEPGATDLSSLTPVLREIAAKRGETVYCAWTAHKQIGDIVFSCSPEGQFGLDSFKPTLNSYAMTEASKGSFLAYLSGDPVKVNRDDLLMVLNGAIAADRLAVQNGNSYGLAPEERELVNSMLAAFGEAK